MRKNSGLHGKPSIPENAPHVTSLFGLISSRDMTLRRTITNWHIVIQGFTQDQDEPTGCEQIWLAMRDYSSPTTQIEIRTWDTHCNRLAERIARLQGNTLSRVALYGYSWGGYTATLLAGELMRYGIGVEQMVLCDAVYRPRCWLGWWRALLPFPKIVIPANVGRVQWFRQRHDFIQGHDLVAACATTVIEPATNLVVPHCDMDKSRLFASACIDVASQMEHRRLVHDLRVFDPARSQP